jgi:hypothetical protein
MSKIAEVREVEPGILLVEAKKPFRLEEMAEDFGKWAVKHAPKVEEVCGYNLRETPLGYAVYLDRKGNSIIKIAEITVIAHQVSEIMFQSHNLGLEFAAGHEYVPFSEN